MKYIHKVQLKVDIKSLFGRKQTLMQVNVKSNNKTISDSEVHKRFTEVYKECGIKVKEDGNYYTLSIVTLLNK